MNIIKILCIAIMLMCVSLNSVAAPPLATIQKAKAMVEEARYQLPVDIGNGISLTQINYDSKTYSLVYRYYCYVPVQRPTNEAIKETKQGLIHLLKAQPNSDEMQYLKNGISFHYNYYSQDGTFLYAIKIAPADVK